MDFCEITDGVLKKFYTCDKDFVIPRGVEVIGDGAFNNYRGIKYLRRLTIPEGVKKIERYAFYICRDLESVKFPQGLETIGESAFHKCESLSELTFRSGLKEIGDSAFCNCHAADSITLPETLTSIGAEAFSRCWNLPVVTLPESLKTIGSYAFSECWGLTELTIPAGVEVIGDNPVSRCWNLKKLTVSEQNRVYKSIDNVIYTRGGSTLCACGWKTGSFSIPAGVAEIRSGAFAKCEKLTEVWLPEGVTRIGDNAFFGCIGLTEVHLPESLREIGNYAFAECCSLKNMNIPDGVTSIGSYAFRDCTDLESISLPDGITGLADNLFVRCRRLVRADIPASVIEIGSSAFSVCESLKEVVFPPRLTKIGIWAFHSCKSLSAINLPESVTKIGACAFYKCTGLTDLTIPAGIQNIASNAFSDCTGLTRVTVPDGVKDVSVLEGCTGVSEYLVPPESTFRKAVDGVLFSKDGRQLVAYPPARECVRYDIPPSVTEVCYKAFLGARVKLIVVPESVEIFAETAVSTDRDTAPFVAYSNPAFTEFLTKPVYLGPPEDLPRRQKGSALNGFVYALKTGMPEIEPWQESWFAAIRQDSKGCEKIAWKNEDLIRLMMELRVLSQETAGHMARKFNNPSHCDLASALYRYLNKF